jgi:hypothetical protein
MYIICNTLQNFTKLRKIICFTKTFTTLFLKFVPLHYKHLQNFTKTLHIYIKTIQKSPKTLQNLTKSYKTFNIFTHFNNNNKTPQYIQTTELYETAKYTQVYTSIHNLNKKHYTTITKPFTNLQNFKFEKMKIYNTLHTCTKLYIHIVTTIYKTKHFTKQTL